MSSKLPSGLLGVAAAVVVGRTWSARGSGLMSHVEKLHDDANIDSWGYQVFSQHSEDGILSVLVSQLKLSGAFVEFGFGIRQNNSLCLALGRQMPGLFIDGSAKTCAAMRRMLGLLKVRGVRVTDAWIDRDNINALILEGTRGYSVDVLSVDIDGVDYWVLEAINSIRPAVIVTEYNASFGKDRSVTVAYDRAYDRMMRTSPLMHGMSLAAATRLANRKGYGLIGCNPEGGNAFFVRDDLIARYRVRSVDEAFRPLRSRLQRLTQEEQEKAALAEPLTEIA